MNLPTAWHALSESVNGRVSFGMRGVRDPDAPCGAFDPVDDIDMLGTRVTTPGGGLCASDGHYLCMGCKNLDVDTWKENDAHHPCTLL